MDKVQLSEKLVAEGVVILAPGDALKHLDWLNQMDFHVQAMICDPWFDKPEGRAKDSTNTQYIDFSVDRADAYSDIPYFQFVDYLLKQGSQLSDHIFLWGFPVELTTIVNRLPSELMLMAWLTWFYKNNPRRTKHWKPSQNACLHLANIGAPTYPEHFEGDEPYDVIEADLVSPKVNFRHAGEKSVEVYKQLILMTTKPGDVVVDLMCGSGTTGVAAQETGRRAIISDLSAPSLALAQERIGVGLTTVFTD